MNAFRKHLLATTCTLGLGGSFLVVAHAAPPTPLPISGWTGAYVGANLGVANLNASATATNGYGEGYGPCTGYYGISSCSTSATGLAVGPEAGYDWQNGSFVYGVVGDWTYTDLKHTVRGSPSFNQPSSFTAQVDWLASFRARMGLALSDTLIYVTGGLALGHVDSSTWAPGSSNNGGNYGSLDSTRVGWVAGLGVEHKFSQQWSLKGEFLYYDLGTQNSPGISRVGLTYSSAFSHEVLLGQVGLAYHF